MSFKLNVWTVAQCLLFPQELPDSPAIARAGILSCVKLPGFLEWEVSLTESIGPEATVIATLISDPAAAYGGVRLNPIPFPPSAPSNTLRVRVVMPDGITTAVNGLALVQFRVDRQGPLEQVQ